MLTNWETAKSVAKLRVGAVNYLNTKPLIRHLPSLVPQIDLVLDVPSQLGVELQEGRLDVGLIPSIEYFRTPGCTIVADVSISSYGPVMSVKLCSQVPFKEIHDVSVDEGSRTSVALMSILMNELFDVRPQTEVLPLHKPVTECKTDAVLVIGDRAMRVADGDYPYTLDLGYEWSRWTGLPFVFAFWTAAPGIELAPDVRRAFVEAKRRGEPEIEQIATDEARRLNIDETRCRYYLRHVIRHDFGPSEREGLLRFYDLAVQYGLASPGVRCVFQGEEHFAKSP